MDSPREAVPVGLTDADLEDARRRGMDLADLAWQVGHLHRPPKTVDIVRPCTEGDGIRCIREREIPALLELHDRAAAVGRFLKFVPASGAASRMFRELEFFLRGSAPGWAEVVERAGRGEREASALTTFVQGVDRLPFRDALRRVLRERGFDVGPLVRQGEFAPLLAALLEDTGLGYSRLPKALIPFHATGRTARTALDEQLIEAAEYVRDGSALCRLHFTVSPDQRSVFEAALRRARRTQGTRLGVRFAAEVSEQLARTETVALDPRGRLVRDAEGRLVFRPSGHGALLVNLNQLGGDLVYVKNIDNVQPEGLRGVATLWKRILGGYLVQLEARCHEIVRRLERSRLSGELLDRALRFTGSRLQVDLDGRLAGCAERAKREWLLERLSRPLRVCGMVRRTGEPGGGPFWVRDREGQVSCQIVEMAQIDSSDPTLQSIVALATHFNPVDLVCSVRDAAGRPFDLEGFADPDAVIVTSKWVDGQEVRVLERPGLWNGGMAQWLSVFVEVPLATFTPVKTFLDLLRSEHQGPDLGAPVAGR